MEYNTTILDKNKSGLVATMKVKNINIIAETETILRV